MVHAHQLVETVVGSLVLPYCESWFATAFWYIFDAKPAALSVIIRNAIVDDYFSTEWGLIVSRAAKNAQLVPMQYMKQSTVQHRNLVRK